jgi:hypothetical protein
VDIVTMNVKEYGWKDINWNYLPYNKGTSWAVLKRGRHLFPRNKAYF